MKVSSFKTLSLIIIPIILISVSCQKQFENSSQSEGISLDNMVNQAKTWFTNGPVMHEKKMLDLPFSILPEMSSQRFFARMSKLQMKLKWENAALYNKEGIEYLVVPVEKGVKPFTKDFEIAKSFVFYIMKSGEMKMNIIEVLSKEGGSLQNMSKEIMATAFSNMIKNTKDPVTGINADVFFYNDTHQSVKSFEIKNGAWRDSKNTLLISQFGGEYTESSQVNKAEASDCETWYVIHSVYVDGVLVHWQILFSYQVGDCGGSSKDEELDDPYGGSGDGSGGSEGNQFDLEAENALMNEVYNTSSESIFKNVSFSTLEPVESQVPFTWVIVKQSGNLWEVKSSDIAKGYNSTNTGAIIYDIEHENSSISGQTFWCRVPRNYPGPCIPLVYLSWQESSNSKTISSNYKSGTVTVSGALKNFGITVNTFTQTCRINV